MGIALERLKSLKQYMVVSHDDDDDEIEKAYYAAIEYLKSAGVSEPDAYNALFDLVVNALTLEYYEHKGLSHDTVLNDNPMLRRALNQLKFSCAK